MEIRVVDVMTTRLISVKPEDSVLMAVNKMIKAGIGNVLVISEDKLKGILTEKDIITKIVALKRNADKFKVKDVMTKKVITAKPSTTVQEAARSMINAGVHRIPITEKGKIIGILTNNDLLRVQPGLMDVLIEKYKYDTPHFSNHSMDGICENCNSYSKELFRVSGSMICLKCKGKF